MRRLLLVSLSLGCLIVIAGAVAVHKHSEWFGASSADSAVVGEPTQPEVVGAVPPVVEVPPPSPAPTFAKSPQSVADSTCGNCVVVSYDDGPSEYTNRLLDILKAKGVRATFMVLAPKVDADQAVVRRMRAEGHTVGNHSVHHWELNKLTPEAIEAEIKGGAAAITRANGQEVHWLRPPFGATSATVDRIAKQYGQAEAMWNIDTSDWKHQDPQFICNAALKEARTGVIILLHDVYKASVDATPCIIDGLRSKNLEPVTLDTLLPDSEPGRRYFNKFQ